MNALEWRKTAETICAADRQIFEGLVADLGACERERNEARQRDLQTFAQRDEWKRQAETAESNYQATIKQLVLCERERDGIRQEYFKQEQRLIREMETHERVVASWKREEAGWDAERTRLREALQNLYDEQNGPPLIRHEKTWQAAMEEAVRALKEATK